MAKSLESWVKRDDKPRSNSGMILKIVMISTRGNPHQIWVAFPRLLAAFNKTWQNLGIGHQRMIPEILKNKQQRATCRVSVPSLTRDAKSPVTVVPTLLALRVNGSICSR
jgi:hypothetical protein